MTISETETTERLSSAQGLSLPSPQPVQAADASAVEGRIVTSVKGQWITVPSLQVAGSTLIVQGKWAKVAVLHDEEWIEHEVQHPQSCIEALKKAHSLKADIFNFAQKLPALTPKFSYPMEWDSVAAIRLSSFDAWWAALPQESRKNVRRAAKRGVVVSVRELDDHLIQGLVELNNDSPVRQGRAYTHFGKTFEQVKHDQSHFLDRSDLICAYCGDELVGFMKVVYRGEIASVLQLLPKASHHDKRPANALVAKAVERCAAKGITHLTFGMFNYGNKRENPLREFKERNGFEEILVPRYYVPLTLRGRVYMKLKLHRGLVGILPHRAIVAGARVRARWYDLKRAISRCSSTSERPNSDRQMERSTPPAGSKPSSPQESH